MTTPLTATIKAWTTSQWRNIDYVKDLIARGDTTEALQSLSYTSTDMSNSEDWIEVGTAQVTVTFHPRDTVVEKELEGLKTQLEKTRAENYMREQIILDRIGKLQAITYTGE